MQLSADPQRMGGNAVPEGDRTDIADIVAAARRNERWAWEQIYDAHAPVLLRYFTMHGARDAEGQVGEVMLRVTRAIDRFSGDEDDLAGWIYRIAQNVMRDEARSAAGAEVPTGDPQTLDERPAGTVIPLTSDEFVQALAPLPASQREVIFLRVVADMSVDQIARHLNTSPGAVKMQQQRALATLRDRSRN